MRILFFIMTCSSPFSWQSSRVPDLLWGNFMLFISCIFL